MIDPVLVSNPARPRDHGSGFVIRRLDGAGAQIVTCSHVVRTLGADGLMVAGQPAKVVIDLAADGVDLAVLAVPGLTEPAPVELGRGTVGEQVQVIGFEPAGGGPVAVPHRGTLAAQSLTALAGKNRPAWQLLLAEGDIEGGHSGGPVVSVRTGRVVGVIAMGPEQKGGKDGVAVAIENLRLWKDAPPVAPARPPTETPLPGDSSGDGSGSLLPSVVRPARRWWWLAALASALAVGVAAVAMKVWSGSSGDPPPPPIGCAIPDIRTSFEQVPVDQWCPDTVAGAPTCRRQFDDGSVVEGGCAGTVATGTWRSTDAQGNLRWEAQFDTRSQRRVGTWSERRVEPSGAVYTATLRYGDASSLASGDGPLARTDEWRCAVAGVGDVVLVEDRVGSPRRLTLSVAGLAAACTIVQEGSDPAVIEQCTGGGRTVTGQGAVEAYRRIKATLPRVQACELAQLPSLPACGDRTVDAGEECDEGGLTEHCTQFCKLSRCGDGVHNPLDREACDSGGVDSRDCDRDCTAVSCGDRLKNTAAGEVCDPPPTRGTARCETNCRAPRCGDGIKNTAAGEQCDATRLPSATCLPGCKLSRCGDGIVNPEAGEQCDERGQRSRSCTAACKRPAGFVPPSPVTPPVRSP